MSLAIKYPLVTLCGSWNFSRTWVRPCIASWKKIKNADQEKYFLVPDANLQTDDEEEFKSLNFQVFRNFEEEFSAWLGQYPDLKLLREKDLTWRKLLDVSWLMKDKGKIALIDTDVFVSSPCFLPQNNFDIAYMREDIPAYRAHWSIVWKEPMVPAFNAGLVIFNPDDIDFSYLNYLAGKYFLNCKDYWWSEQAAWACIAGKLKNRHLFDGKQVRVISGFKKRTPSEVLNNDFNYFGKRGQIKSFEEFKPYLGGSVITHFAGLGKHFFDQSVAFFEDEQRHVEPIIINSVQEQTLSFKDKIGIGSRLFLKELK